MYLTPNLWDRRRSFAFLVFGVAVPVLTFSLVESTIHSKNEGYRKKKAAMWESLGIWQSDDEKYAPKSSSRWNWPFEGPKPQRQQQQQQRQ
jgi:hypothetical protein